MNVHRWSHDLMKVALMTPNQKKKLNEKQKRINNFRNLYQNYINEVRRRNAQGLPINNLVEPKYPVYNNNNNNNNQNLPLPEPTKSMNNININASALFNSPVKHRRKSTPKRLGPKRNT
jgi:hypothetical protein